MERYFWPECELVPYGIHNKQAHNPQTLVHDSSKLELYSSLHI